MRKLEGALLALHLRALNVGDGKSFANARDDAGMCTLHHVASSQPSSSVDASSSLESDGMSRLHLYSCGCCWAGLACWWLRTQSKAHGQCPWQCSLSASSLLYFCRMSAVDRLESHRRQAMRTVSPSLMRRDLPLAKPQILQRMVGPVPVGTASSTLQRMSPSSLVTVA